MKIQIEEGRFQQSLAFMTAGASFVSALEVGYEHYKGSYSNPIMYSPVVLGGLLTAASLGAVFSPDAATGAMRWLSAVTLADGIVGFGFHIRGIARKPGGWSLLLTNVVMGPPLFAPLLFGASAYLGLMASYLRREDHRHIPLPPSGWRHDIHFGRFQKHLALITAFWTLFCGFESYYSHYKNNFRFKAQWSPLLLAPIHLAACLGAIPSKRIAKKVLPVTSALAVADGAIGFGYHVRGILRRPGGKKTWLYNILYGPPIFAPLLFAACGVLGGIAVLLRRERYA